ncbi:MAG TPA: M23 family metallopeptidase [Gammaproteobacteria bacterium]|nr:M23 family metallopeptidase [Gammaproteobacteria bacterium]
MKQDYKPVARRTRGAALRHFLLVCAAAAIAAGAIRLGQAIAARLAPAATPSAPAALSLPAGPYAPLEPAKSLDIRVASGDTLAQLFARHGLASSDLHAILALGEPVTRLKRLLPDDNLTVRHDPQGSVIDLRLAVDESRELRVARNAMGFTAATFTRPLQQRLRHASGRIESSLFTAAREAGLSDTLAMALADIFGWDIDFMQDLRSGDTFTVIYEELWRDGEKLRDGAILAAEFVNAGRSHRAIRFEDPDGNVGYFTPDGRSLRRTFIRNPVDFTRVSSRFSLRRMHPILNKVRAHKGVDYAAPAGTPVRAAGDGKVVFRGMKGGYGNTVIIQHGATYTTLYAHLSRFARGITVGARVRQNQVIGYVGSTGLATAPHLHYEIRVNGVHRDPRRVPLPEAAPLREDYRVAFDRAAAPLLRQLDELAPRPQIIAARGS